jgi:DNA-binding CsgD family transcriptional regulator
MIGLMRLRGISGMQHDMGERSIVSDGDLTRKRQATLQPLAGLPKLTRDQVAAAAAELSISVSQCYRLIGILRADPSGRALQPRKRGRPPSTNPATRAVPRTRAADVVRDGPKSGQLEEELIALIYEGCLESKPWSSFLRALRLHVDCDTVDISLIPGRPAIPPISIWDTRLSISAAEVETAEGLQKKLLHLDPMTSRKWRPGEILHIDEVTSRDELRRNRFYQELMRPYNIEYVMAMHCVEPLGWSCLLGLMNGPDRRNFDGGDKALFARLRPHLERSLRIYARMAMDRSEKDIFEDAVTRLAVGVIVLDLHGRVLHVNPVAQAIAGRSAEMTLTNDRISLGHRKLNTELREAIAAAAGIAPGQEDSFAKALRVEDENGDLMSLMVCSVPASGDFQAETSPRVVIYLSDPSHRYLTPEYLIAQLFELTPAEAALALTMANGATIVEAARQFNLTENTARSYLKRIFAKTGVRRQAHLVRLILQSVALLG